MSKLQKCKGEEDGYAKKITILIMKVGKNAIDAKFLKSH